MTRKQKLDSVVLNNKNPLFKTVSLENLFLQCLKKHKQALQVKCNIRLKGTKVYLPLIKETFVCFL